MENGELKSDRGFYRDMVAVIPPKKLKGCYYKPRDGVYNVETFAGRWPSRAGSILIHDGKVRRCSPCLKRRIHIYWHLAQWVLDV